MVRCSDRFQRRIDIIRGERWVLVYRHRDGDLYVYARGTEETDVWKVYGYIVYAYLRQLSARQWRVGSFSVVLECDGNSIYAHWAQLAIFRRLVEISSK